MLKTVKEVSEQLNLSLSKVYQLLAENKLSHYRLDGAIRVSEEQIAEYLEERKRERGTNEPRELQRRPRPRVILKHL